MSDESPTPTLAEEIAAILFRQMGGNRDSNLRLATQILSVVASAATPQQEPTGWTSEPNAKAIQDDKNYWESKGMYGKPLSSEPEMVATPARCDKCGVQVHNPTTGKMASGCYRCDGTLVTSELAAVPDVPPREYPDPLLAVGEPYADVPREPEEQQP